MCYDGNVGRKCNCFQSQRFCLFSRKTKRRVVAEGSVALSRASLHCQPRVRRECRRRALRVKPLTLLLFKIHCPFRTLSPEVTQTKNVKIVICCLVTEQPIQVSVSYKVKFESTCQFRMLSERQILCQNIDLDFC